MKKKAGRALWGVFAVLLLKTGWGSQARLESPLPANVSPSVQQEQETNRSSSKPSFLNLPKTTLKRVFGLNLDRQTVLKKVQQTWGFCKENSSTFRDYTIGLCCLLLTVRLYTPLGQLRDLLNDLPTLLQEGHEALTQARGSLVGRIFFRQRAYH